MEKLCWCCKHCFFMNSTQHYSDLTPGYEATLECSKKYWEVDFNEDSLAEFREKITTAKSCDDFAKREIAEDGTPNFSGR